MKCTCSEHSPFLWYKNPRPSIFIKAKPQQTEEAVLSYRVFGVYSLARASTKPQKNRHEK